MRYLLSASFWLSAVAAGGVVQADEAAEQVAGEVLTAPVFVTPELIGAQHAFQLAHLRWQQYRLVELPQQRQLLDNQIRLVESELGMLKRRLHDYRPFLEVGRYSPVRTAAENDRLLLQALRQQLRLLRNARINLMRLSRRNSQLYQLEVLRTAATVRELLANTPAPRKQ